MLLLLTVKMITAKNHAVLVAILFLFVVIVIYESEKWIKIGMPSIANRRSFESTPLECKVTTLNPD